MTPSDPTTRALAYWLFTRAVKTVGWCGRKAWEHREEISQATRVAAKAGVAAGRVTAKGARTVYEHREQIAQATSGALRGGATAARHCAAPFSARKQIDAEYQAVRQQVTAYKRLTDRRYEAIATGRAKRETLLDALLVGGHTLAAYAQGAAVSPAVRRAYEMAYPGLAKVHSFGDQVHRLDADQLMGFASGVKGKLFEQKLVQQLNEGHLPDGYRAFLAESATQPGWDIGFHGPDAKVVEVLQAKATDSVSYVREALARYPNIDVITTKEVGAQLAMQGLSEHVTTSDISDAALERVVHSAIEAQTIHMHYMPSLLVLGLIAYMSFKGRGSLAEQGRVFGERATKNYVAYLVGGGAAVLTQTWWMAIPAGVGTRVLMGSGARMAKHLQALRELREANDRVLQRMQGAWAMG